MKEQQQQKNNDWSNRDIGALWKREGKNQRYLSGYVKIDELGSEREVKVVVFSNKNKKDNDKAPDYRIYISKPVENNNQTKAIPTQNKQPLQKPAPKKQVEVEEEEDLL